MSKRTSSHFYWDNWLDLAKAYYAEHGDLRVRSDYITPCGKLLGRWIGTQRTNKKGNGKSCLTNDQIVSLEAIGMVWELEKRTPWDVYYEHAMRYYAENGNLLTQSALKTKDGLWLGNWIVEQRKQYKRSNLSQERIEKLEAIAMVWEVVKRPPWPKWYAKAQEFYEEHGHLRIPKEYITSDGWALGDWISTQRRRYSGQIKPLTNEQIDALEKIGMQWRVFEQRWAYMFGLAQEYAKEHGFLNMTRSYIHPNGEKLGVWLQTQRRKYLKGMLEPEKIEDLESISMIWQTETGKSNLNNIEGTYYHVAMEQISR